MIFGRSLSIRWFGCSFDRRNVYLKSFSFFLFLSRKTPDLRAGSSSSSAVKKNRSSHTNTKQLNTEQPFLSGTVAHVALQGSLSGRRCPASNVPAASAFASAPVLPPRSARRSGPGQATTSVPHCGKTSKTLKGIGPKQEAASWEEQHARAGITGPI